MILLITIITSCPRIARFAEAGNLASLNEMTDFAKEWMDFILITQNTVSNSPDSSIHKTHVYQLHSFGVVTMQG